MRRIARDCSGSVSASPQCTPPCQEKSSKQRCLQRVDNAYFKNTKRYKGFDRFVLTFLKMRDHHYTLCLICRGGGNRLGVSRQRECSFTINKNKVQ